MARHGQQPEWWRRAAVLATARAGIGLILLLALHTGLGATALEYRVKAAYLYNFFLFVDWPEQSFTCDNDCFELCILGRDPFGEGLAALTRKTAQERPIRLRRLGDGHDPSGCHVLFIDETKRSQLPQILRSARRSHVLTVSEMPNFASSGGMVGFTIQGGKVRLEVNLASVRQAGLRVSSKLLEVAAEVYRR